MAVEAHILQNENFTSRYFGSDGGTNHPDTDVSNFWQPPVWYWQFLVAPQNRHLCPGQHWPKWTYFGEKIATISVTAGISIYLNSFLTLPLRLHGLVVPVLLAF